MPDFYIILILGKYIMPTDTLYSTRKGLIVYLTLIIANAQRETHTKKTVN